MSLDILVPVLVATVTGAFSVAGTWLITHQKAKQDSIDNAVREQRQMMRLDQLEKKVDIHNGYAKRFGEIEKSIVRIETKIGDIVDGSCKIKTK